jgi:hypothetical protein
VNVSYAVSYSDAETYERMILMDKIRRCDPTTILDPTMIPPSDAPTHAPLESGGHSGEAMRTIPGRDPDRLETAAM